MEQENEKLELVYGLEDKPSPLETAYAALQHLLAIIVGIITPTLIIDLHSGQENWTSRFRFVKCSGD